MPFRENYSLKKSMKKHQPIVRYAAFLFLFCWNGLNAQSNLQHLTPLDGLPSSDIYQAVQDKDGFLYLATSQGLVRYDGYSFVPLLEGKVMSVAIKERTLFAWNINLIAYSINNQQSKTLQKVIFTDGNPNNDIFTNLFCDSKERIWMNDHQYLKYYSLQKKQLYTFDIHEIMDDVLRLAHFFEDANHHIWTLTRGGNLMKFDEISQTFQQIYRFSEPISCLFFDNKNTLYAGSTQGNVFSYWIDKEQFIKKTPILNQSSITSVTAVGEVLYVGGYGSFVQANMRTGIIKRNPFFTENGVHVSHILTDEANHCLWVSSNQGLFKLKTGQMDIEYHHLPKELVTFPTIVNAFAKHDDTHFWLALNCDKALLWNSETDDYQAVTFSEKKIATNCILRLSSGGVLAGTNDGVFKLGAKTAQKIIDCKPVISMIEDQQHRIWVLPEHQPVRVFNARFVEQKKYCQNTTLFWTENEFRKLKEDQNGTVWMAGWMPKSYGFCRFYPDSSHFFDVVRLKNQQPSIFVSDSFLDLTLDNKGELLGSAFGGVNRFDLNGIAKDSILVNKKFPAHDLRHIAQAANGTIWLGAGEGLFTLSNDFKQTKRYTQSEGLLTENTTGGFLLDRDNLYLGATNQFSILNVNTFGVKNNSKKPVLNYYEIEGEKYFWNETPIFLNTQNQSINFVLSQLNFENKLQNFYRYKLLPNQNNWVEVKDLNNLNFTQLAPNHYQLLVQSGNNHGAWQNDFLTIPLIVVPKFYQTDWFKFLIISTLIGILYSFYYARLQRVKVVQRVRDAISRDLHDDMGATLSSINILNTVVQQRTDKNASTQPLLARINEEVQLLQGKLEEIIWSLRSDRDKLGLLFERLIRFSSELLEAKNIDFHYEIDEKIKQVGLSMEERRTIYLIAKEAMINIAKYSFAQKATLRLYRNKGKIHLLILDDGIGFDLNAPREGNGLRNMKTRAAELNADFYFFSAPQQGTKMEIKWKLSPKRVIVK